jgi:ribosomal protein S18 acetylase RimI-like enzyme
VATEVVLPDGTRAITWALLPQDRDELARGYEELDPESKYHRFLSAVPRLSDAMLDHLVDEVDGVDHVALVLFVLDDQTVGTPAGVARMIRYPDDPEAADVAVTVLPAYRGRGVASTLLAELVVERPAGVHRIVTEVAADNLPSLRMLQRLGPTRVAPDGDHTLQVEVELPQAGPRAAATAR